MRILEPQVVHGQPTKIQFIWNRAAKAASGRYEKDTELRIDGRALRIRRPVTLGQPLDSVLQRPRSPGRYAETPETGSSRASSHLHARVHDHLHRR